MSYNDLSIHPRAWGGKALYPKVNTCKPHSRAKLERAAAGIKRHLAEHPRDEAAQQRLANLMSRINALPKQQYASRQAAE